MSVNEKKALEAIFKKTKDIGVKFILSGGDTAKTSTAMDSLVEDIDNEL